MASTIEKTLRSAEISVALLKVLAENSFDSILITDTTAMNGSANFTDASANRASEVATFFNEPSLVHDLRVVFDDYWKQARPY